MFSNCINFKKQGDMGMCYAIAYYSKLGWTISIPVTDSQDYDLIVDTGTKLLKVQVKTTTQISEHGIYIVSLKTCEGNKSGHTHYYNIICCLWLSRFESYHAHSHRDN